MTDIPCCGWNLSWNVPKTCQSVKKCPCPVKHICSNRSLEEYDLWRGRGVLILWGVICQKSMRKRERDDLGETICRRRLMRLPAAANKSLERRIYNESSVGMGKLEEDHSDTHTRIANFWKPKLLNRSICVVNYGSIRSNTDTWQNMRRWVWD